MSEVLDLPREPLAGVPGAPARPADGAPRALPAVLGTALRRAAPRVLSLLLVVLGIAVLNFFILQLAPGDVVDVLAGEAGGASPEYMALLRERFGLDAPWHVQLLNYLGQLLTLDLGFSFRHNMPVVDLVAARLPATLLLMLSALGLALVLGVLLGVSAARKPGGAWDATLSVVGLVSYALPTFWLGLMAIVLFAGHLGWLPSSGMVDLSADHSGWDHVRDVAAHTVLPASVLATFYIAVYARLVRAAMVELQGADFVRTARAKGASDARARWRHAFRNALLPLVTMVGFQTASLLSGAVLVESVFDWPGLGRLTFESIQARDFNLLLSILFLSSLLVVAVNLVVDLLYGWLDPRVRVEGDA
ncbi:ABC transporter permease [Comamonas serinivorans]|uniref:ABC transporter permease n=1 Tax=Comamonas serinivorans TaxID=1082851 RepID=A0A1Y0ENS4_9BURK|nr:ABC transporter permease [Comamonas serinivorans]ARU04969.1 ABC transporter permease [Comamonas serinivorans]